MKKKELIGTIVIGLLIVFVLSIMLLFKIMPHTCCDVEELFFITIAAQFFGIMLVFLFIGITTKK